MMKLVLLVGLTVLFPAVTATCCLPAKWEGMESFTVGTVTNGHTTISQGFMNISSDTMVKKIALNMTVTTKTGSGEIKKSKMFVLQDIDQKIQYVVENSLCKKSVLNAPMNSCIPSTYFDYIGTNDILTSSASQFLVVSGNATVVSKTTVGSDHTPATIYHIPFGSMGDGFLTVTDSGCVPVLYQVTADINDSKTIESVGMYGIMEGIKDTSVFTVPDVCKTPGRVINTKMPQIKVGF